MTNRLSAGYIARLTDALVAEIKAQMGRRGVSSSRALADLIGANSQWMSQRLDGGNRRGERVPLTVSDLSRIAAVLDVDPVVLLERARIEAGPVEYEDALASRRARKSDPATTVEADRIRVADEGDDIEGEQEQTEGGS